MRGMIKVNGTDVSKEVVGCLGDWVNDLVQGEGLVVGKMVVCWLGVKAPYCQHWLYVEAYMLRAYAVSVG